MMGLAGKYKDHVVVITGAAQGMGRDMALLLAKNGCAGLALADYNELELDKTAADIGDLCPVSTCVVDVRDTAEIERFRDETIYKHGRVSVLINNAGVTSVGSFEEQTKGQFDRILDINYGAVVDCSRTFFPIMKREKDAHIVNISSMYGYFAGDSNAISYHASKFAVRGFTESLEVDCQKSSPQVKMHVVHPGYIRTSLVQNAPVYAKMSKGEALSWFDSVGLTTSIQAAKTILEGVAANRFRIRVGPDAYMLDYLVRLFPETYLKNSQFRQICLRYCGITSAVAAKVRDYIRLGDLTCLLIVLYAQFKILRRTLRYIISSAK